MDFNIYCDESCHLEHDEKQFMVLGALWSPKDQARRVSESIENIKNKYKINKTFEIKWTKVSGSDRFLPFYKELLDLFFSDPSLHFRAIIIDKTCLDHERYNQTHDTWYYKMYFRLISNILRTENKYNIYLDIKDTKSNNKTQQLREYINRANYTYNPDIVEKIQLVLSKEVKQIQLADLLIGLVQYKHNMSVPAGTKAKLLRHLEVTYKKDLTKNTLPSEDKFNIFHWEGR